MQQRESCVSKWLVQENINLKSHFYHRGLVCTINVNIRVNAFVWKYLIYTRKTTLCTINRNLCCNNIFFLILRGLDDMFPCVIILIMTMLCTGTYPYTKEYQILKLVKWTQSHSHLRHSVRGITQQDVDILHHVWTTFCYNYYGYKENPTIRLIDRLSEALSHHNLSYECLIIYWFSRLQTVTVC